MKQIKIPNLLSSGTKSVEVRFRLRVFCDVMHLKRVLTQVVEHGWIGLRKYEFEITVADHDSRGISAPVKVFSEDGPMPRAARQERCEAFTIERCPNALNPCA